jgi:hypothetical protein
MEIGLGVCGAGGSAAGWVVRASGAERRRRAAGFFLAAFFLADFLVGFFLAVAPRAACFRAGARAVFLPTRALSFFLRVVPDFFAAFLPLAFLALAISSAPRVA